MSKNAKILLIIAGILVFISIACVGGFAFFTYFFVDHEGISKSLDEGTAFGKTTDNSGCQTKVSEIIKPLSETDINGSVKAQYFFKGCLGTSRPSPNFCDGLPSEYADILNNGKAKENECQKLGFGGSPNCRQVMKEKLDYCGNKR